MSNNDESTQKEIDAAVNEDEEERAYGLDLRVVVNGELYREWPQDLFIPPDALEVFLESFEGPLDLLLYLIRKENLDILDIPIAEITKQYMEYVEMMRAVKLDLAAEYLLMAAMLAEIKSRMLLPRPETDEDEEDPRSALVRRLQEYERYREAAVELDQLPRVERDLFVAKGRFVDPSPIVPEATVTLDQLAEAFAQVVANAVRFQHLHVTRERLRQIHTRHHPRG